MMRISWRYPRYPAKQPTAQTPVRHEDIATAVAAARLELAAITKGTADRHPRRRALKLRIRMLAKALKAASKGAGAIPAQFDEPPRVLAIGDPGLLSAPGYGQDDWRNDNYD